MRLEQKDFKSNCAGMLPSKVKSTSHSFTYSKSGSLSVSAGANLKKVTGKMENFKFHKENLQPALHKHAAKTFR